MLQNDPESEAHRLEMENLDVQFIDMHIHLEKKHGDICKAVIPFSEPVKVWDFRRKVRAYFRD